MIEEIKSKLDQNAIVKDVTEFRLGTSPVAFIDIETFGFDQKPGDCPHFRVGEKIHGIAGIAVGTMTGESVYIVVNDGKNYGGVPIDQAISLLNNWLLSSKMLVVYFGKFDFGFLLSRGLKVSHLRIVDAWLVRNIKSQGNYSANKLKAVMRTKFNLSTTGEELKDKWMEEHNTKDFGDLPLEIISPYACLDVKYTALAFFGENDLTVDDWYNHDLYARNTFHLIKAEEHGIKIDLDLMRQRLAIVEKAIAENQRKFLDQIGSAGVDPNDEQAALRYLHSKNLHSPPREMYGEVQFVLDEEFLLACDHPLARAYYDFSRYKAFRTCFSGNHGEMTGRIFMSPEQEAGFHPNHLLSVFSRGGIPQVRHPDITGRVKLANDIRELFVPRKGFKFVTLRAHDLMALLMAFYCSDLELMATIRMGVPQGMLGFIAARNAFNPKLASLCLRQQFEGSGAERLINRLKLAEIKGFSDKKAAYALQDKFVAQMPGLAAMRERLKASIKDNGTVRDRLGRILRIEEKSQYRAQAVLIQSSNGSILSYYLDVFCRVAAETGAQLVLAHEKEFIFETPISDMRFEMAALEVSRQKLIDPAPVWLVQVQKEKWSSSHLDSHELALGAL